MALYKIPYGKSEQTVELPEGHVAQVLLPPVTGKTQSIEALMAEALASPIGTPTLDKMITAGDTVVIVVSDITRTWARFDLFVPILVNELNRLGVPDQDISVIIATGNTASIRSRKKRRSWAANCIAVSKSMTMIRLQKPAVTWERPGGGHRPGSINGRQKPIRSF